MTGAEYAYLVDFLNERSGLALGDDKRYLVEARLGPIARRAGIASLSELVVRLARGDDLGLSTAVVEAMTTNETFFFRDGAPFKQFADVMLPALMAARSDEKRIRIWSTACSTGQEPYSLAMLLEERAAALGGWRVEIMATDLNAEVVERARIGLFSQFEVQRGLQIRRLLANFTQEGANWRINPELRARVQFRTLNLKRDFSSLGRFDVVFCRNVLMYLDARARQDVLGRIAAQTAPGGYLVMGAAETLGSSGSFVAHAGHPGLFTPAERARAPFRRLALV